MTSKIKKRTTADAVSGVLFLQGVFLKDCKTVETMFASKIMDTQSKFDKIPSVFVNLETYVKSTNLLCWNCHLPVKGRPCFRAVSINPLGNGHNSFTPRGNFNHFACVRRYIDVHTKDLGDRLNEIAMLKLVYEQYTGEKAIDIKPAPPHTEMEQYGGKLTPAEYMRACDKQVITARDMKHDYTIQLKQIESQME